MIDAPVVGGQRRDHFVLLLPAGLLFQQLILQGQPVLQFLLLGLLAFRQLRVGPLKFFPGGFLVPQFPAGAPSVADQEQDDQAGRGDENHGKGQGIAPDHIAQGDRIQPVVIAEGEVLGII